jgi:chromosomal replication initiator protein
MGADMVGGFMIDFYNTTPESYAKRIAKHISDPSTIRARTADQFGRHRAPSIEQCRLWREKAVYRPVRRHEKPFLCGHERTFDNSHELSSGKETCLACHRAAQEKRRAEQEAARARKDVLAEEARIAAYRAAVAAKRACIEPIENRAMPNEIMTAVASAFAITLGELKGEARAKLYVSARTVAAKLLREEGSSYPMVARRMNRDHSSIINLLNKWDKRVAKYPYMLTVYEALRK